MANDHAGNSTGQDVDEKQKAEAKPKRRRWPWVLLGLVVVVLVLVALAPTLMSLGPARRFALGIVNENLNGKADIQSWSLGWFSGVRLEGITVTDAKGEPAIEIESITLPASVPALLGATKRLGTIDVQKPKLNVVVYADGTINLMTIAKPSDEPEKPPEPLGFDVVAALAVRGAELTVRRADGADPLLVRDLDVSATIESLEKAIAFEVTGTVGTEKAPLNVKGSATAFKNGMPAPDDLVADVQVALAGCKLAPMSGLARQFGSPVDFAGALTVDVSAKTQGMNSLSAKGKVELADVTLAGGPLGDDKPSFDKMTLDYDVAKTDATVTIASFRFQSPVATATTSGQMTIPPEGELPTGDLTSSTRVDLAALAARMPHTLHLQEGLTLESGTLALESKVGSSGGASVVESSIRIEGLAATRDGKRIALAEPIALVTKATHTDKGPRVDTLELTSSFAKASGSGDLDAFRLQLTSDLAAAMAEAAKFVDVGDASASGTASVDVHLTTTDAKQRKADVAVALADLKLGGFGPKPVALQAAKLTMAALAELDDQQALQQIRDVALTATLPFATAQFTATSVKPVEGGDLPVTMAGGRLRAQADLAKAFDFGRGLADVPADLALTGQAQVNCGLTVADGVVQAEGLDATLTALDVAQGDKHFRQDKIQLTGRAEATPKASRAAVRDLALQLSFGKLEVPSVAVPDWTKAPDGASAEIRGDIDIAKLLAALADFAPLPDNTTVAAQALLQGTVGAKQGATQANLKAQLVGLKVVSDGKTVADGEKVVLDALASVAKEFESFDLQTLKLTSTFANLDAKATVADIPTTRKLKAEGTLDCDFGRIGPLVAAFSGQDIEMSGRQARPFKVDTSLVGKTWQDIVRTTLASAGIYIERVKVMGIETGVIDIPMAAKDGKTTIRVETTLNDGKLLVPLTLDATGDTAVVSLPDNTAMLSSVKITSEMADAILSRVSPIFKGAAVAAGTVDITSRKLHVPVVDDMANKLTAEADLELKGVALTPGGFLKSVFEMAKSEAKQVQLPDQKLTVAVVKGRIIHSPISLPAGKATLQIGGSVGFDTTLDMFMQVPITEELLGGKRALYEFLKDEAIRVPITGTVAQPVFDRKAFASNLTRLIKSAAKKAIGDKLKLPGGKGLKGLFNRK